MAHESTLKQHMSGANRNALGKLPTTHENCIEKCGVARPGKTARDLANKNGAAALAERLS